MIISTFNTEFEDHLSRIGNCETHIFDPTPGIEDKLKNITLSEKYHFHFEAFGGQINKELVIPPQPGAGDHKKPQKFRTKTLDEFVSELNTPYIDILKIDVETAELNDIYNNEPDSIWRLNRIGQVLIEVHLNFDDENTNTFQKMFELFDFLASNGFVLFHSVSHLLLHLNSLLVSSLTNFIYVFIFSLVVLRRNGMFMHYTLMKSLSSTSTINRLRRLARI